MITQKDVHNCIVEKAEPWQKEYIALRCDGDPEKIKGVEQSIANMVNCIVSVISNPGTDYLNRRID